MRSKRNDTEVLVIGRSCVDVIAIIDRFPEEDTKEPIHDRIIEGGGQGGTAACCIARLGGKVAYWGKVGDDDEGKFCLQRLKDFGVDTGLIEVVPGGKTPVAHIYITRETGKRTIFYEKNTLPPLEATRLKDLFSPPPAVVLLDPETTYLVEEIKNHGGRRTKIVYDCERWNPFVERAMALSDYFIPSADFFLSPETGGKGTLKERLMSFTSLISGQLIVTHGPKGAYFSENGLLFHVPAPVVEVKDTTGAGDNFHAAFSLALSRGYSLKGSVKFAVAVASLSCRALGGRAGLPSLTEALAWARRLKVIKYGG